MKPKLFLPVLGLVVFLLACGGENPMQANLSDRNDTVPLPTVAAKKVKVDFTATIDVSPGADSIRKSFVDKNGRIHVHGAFLWGRPITGDIEGTVDIIQMNLHQNPDGSGTVKGKFIIYPTSAPLGLGSDGFWRGRFNGVLADNVVSEARFNLKGRDGLQRTKLKGTFFQPTETLTLVLTGTVIDNRPHPHNGDGDGDDGE